MTLALDHPGPWTVADVLALPEDRGVRHELLDGMLLVSPNPAIPHQRMSLRLAHVLDSAAPPDLEVLEAVNVEMPSGLLIPDLIVAEATAAENAGLTLPASALRLAVEIVSPSSRRMDRRMKPSYYAEAGVPCYWQVELDGSPRIVTYCLSGEKYVETGTADAGAPLRVTEPYALELDLGTLLARRR